MAKYRALNITLSLLTGLAIFVVLVLMCEIAGGVGVLELSLIAVAAGGGRTSSVLGDQKLPNRCVSEAGGYWPAVTLAVLEYRVFRLSLSAVSW